MRAGSCSSARDEFAVCMREYCVFCRKLLHGMLMTTFCVRLRSLTHWSWLQTCGAMGKDIVSGRLVVGPFAVGCCVSRCSLCLAGPAGNDAGNRLLTRWKTLRAVVHDRV